MSEEKGRYVVSQEELDDADALIRGIVEVIPETNSVVVDAEGEISTKKQPAYIKLWVGIRDSLLRKMKGSKLSVFLCIASHLNAKGYSFPSIATITHETGYSEREVQRAIRELTEMKILSVSEYYVDSGRQSSNTYNVKAIASYVEKVTLPPVEKDTLPRVKSHPLKKNHLKENQIKSGDAKIASPSEVVAEGSSFPSSEKEEEPAISSFPEEDQSQQQTEYKGDYAQLDADEILGADIIARTRRYKDNAPPRQRLGKELDIYAADRRGDSAIEWFSESENYLLDVVSTLFSLSPPLGNRSRLADWKNGLRDIQEACGGSLEFTKQVLTEYHRQWFSDLHDPKREALTISRPGSLVEPCRAFAGRMRMASTGRDGPNGRFKTIDEFFAYIESLPQSEWHQTRLRMGFEFDPERRVYTPPWKTPVVDGVLEWFD